MIRKFIIPKVTPKTTRLCVTLSQRNVAPSRRDPSQVCETIVCSNNETALFIHKFALDKSIIPGPIIKYSEFSIDHNTLCFPIDSLLYNQPCGRYQGKVYTGTTLVGYTEFDYCDVPDLEATNLTVDNSSAPDCEACQ
jgi:hypothetical protein